MFTSCIYKPVCFFGPRNIKFLRTDNLSTVFWYCSSKGARFDDCFSFSHPYNLLKSMVK